MKFPQTLTYWHPNGSTNLYGSPSFSKPVWLDCRWEDKVELFRDKEGQEVNSRSKIFMLNMDIDLNGYLFLGRTSEVDPKVVEGAYEIRGVTRIPDLRGLKELVVLWL